MGGRGGGGCARDAARSGARHHAPPPPHPRETRAGASGRTQRARRHWRAAAASPRCARPRPRRRAARTLCWAGGRRRPRTRRRRGRPSRRGGSRGRPERGTRTKGAWGGWAACWRAAGGAAAAPRREGDLGERDARAPSVIRCNTRRPPAPQNRRTPGRTNPAHHQPSSMSPAASDASRRATSSSVAAPAMAAATAASRAAVGAVVAPPLAAASRPAPGSKVVAGAPPAAHAASAEARSPGPTLVQSSRVRLRSLWMAYWLGRREGGGGVGGAFCFFRGSFVSFGGLRPSTTPTPHASPPPPRTGTGGAWSPRCPRARGG